VRILKNARGKLIADGALADGIAPSYFIEGLLYNVPNDKFGGSLGDAFVDCINWIRATDRSSFVCANEQYYLLKGDANVTWTGEKCVQFLNAVAGLWKHW
jgi:hypothetical protein